MIFWNDKSAIQNFASYSKCCFVAFIIQIVLKNSSGICLKRPFPFHKQNHYEWALLIRKTQVYISICSLLPHSIKLIYNKNAHEEPNGLEIGMGNFPQHLPQEFPTRFSCNNFPQDFPARISCKIFPQDFPARFSRKNFQQDFP